MIIIANGVSRQRDSQTRLVIDKDRCARYVKIDYGHLTVLGKLAAVGSDIVAKVHTTSVVVAGLLDGCVL